MIIMKSQGEDDGNTCFTTTEAKPADSGVTADSTTLASIPRLMTAARESSTYENGVRDAYWHPDYDGEMDEFLAFCLEGFLIDSRWPEQEIIVEHCRKKKNRAKKSSIATLSKSKSTSKKKKSKSMPTKLTSRAEDKHNKEEVRSGAESTLGTRKSKSKKKTCSLSKSRSSSKTSTSKLKKQQQSLVDKTPLLIRKTSYHTGTESSSDISFYDDNSDISGCENDRLVDEEVQRAMLKANMIQTATAAASLGRLTRLAEKVVETVASEAPACQQPVDTWKIKKNAGETELNRSNHFQIINEAAAMGQMKRIRTNGTMSLTGVAEHGEERHEGQASHNRGPRYLLRRRKLLLSSHERMDRYVEDAVEEKKKTMYAPEHVLERQQHNNQMQSLFHAGDVDWLPTSEVPTFVVPKVYLSKKRIRESLVTEVAQACSLRNHRLSCNFRLNIRRRCKCIYCKAPSAIQTQVYQQLYKEMPKTESSKPKLLKGAPTSLTRPYRSNSLVPSTKTVTEPSALYSRSILRRSQTQPLECTSFKHPPQSPAWASAALKKAAVVKKTREEILGDSAPVWVLATGKRDNDDLPEWASQTLRELVSPLSGSKSSSVVSTTEHYTNERGNDNDNQSLDTHECHWGLEPKNDIPSSPGSVGDIDCSQGNKLS